MYICTQQNIDDFSKLKICKYVFQIFRFYISPLRVLTNHFACWLSALPTAPSRPISLSSSSTVCKEFICCIRNNT